MSEVASFGRCAGAERELEAALRNLLAAVAELERGSRDEARERIADARGDLACAELELLQSMYHRHPYL